MAKKNKVTVVVLEVFQDKFDHKTQYPVGTELQVDKERADDLVSRGLALIKEEEEPKKPVSEKSAPAEGTKEKSPVTDNPETKQADDKGTEKQ